jgi:outer membrane protein TolC
MPRLGLVAVFAALPLAGAAQESAPAAPLPVLALDEAIRLALEQNRLVQVAALEVEKANETLRAAATRRYPKLDVFGLGARLVEPLDVRFPVGSFGNFPSTGPIPPFDATITTPPRFAGAVLVTAAQPLTQQYRIGLGLDLLRFNRDLAREGHRQRSHAVRADVKRLYYTIVEAQAGLETLDEALRLFTELDRLLRDYVATEAALPADHLEVEAQLEKTRHQHLEVTNNLATLKEQLNALLGRDVLTAFRAAPLDDELAEVGLGLEEARTLAFERRPELKEARLKKGAAEADRKFKKSEYLPDVSAFFGYLGLGNVEFFPRHAAAFGLTLTWEPFDWGRKSRELAARTRTEEQAQAGLREAEALVTIDVNHRFRKLAEARALVRATEAARRAASERLRIAREKQGQEAVLVKDVLSAQAVLAEATQRHQQSRLAFRTARAELEKAIGEP